MTVDLEALINAVGDKSAPGRFIGDLRSELIAEAEFLEQQPALVWNEADLAPVIPLEAVFAESSEHDLGGVARIAGRWLAIAACSALLVLVGVATLGQTPETGNLQTLATPNETLADSAPVAQVMAEWKPTLPPGRYSAEALGASFTFETRLDTPVLRSDEHVLQLGAPLSWASDQQMITFVRLSTLSDSEQAPTVGGLDVPDELPGDVDALIRYLSAEHRVSEVVEATIDGLTATRFDVSQRGAASSLASEQFALQEHQRVWFLDEGQEDPIVVIVSNAVNCRLVLLQRCDDGWLANAQRILWTVELE